MIEGLLGKKIGMTQVFDDNGQNCIPVTVIEVGPAVATQIKTIENDGYQAVQIGFAYYAKNKLKRVAKPIIGHFKKNKEDQLKDIDISTLDIKRHLREFALSDESQTVDRGQEFDVSLFEGCKYVDVSGTSKGKGFAGVIKRHNFGGGPGSHGHRFHRSTGSIGQSATPSRVFKGKKMPGHMGNERVTTKGLEIIKILSDKNVMLVKGAIPGPNNRLVEVRKSNKS